MGYVIAQVIQFYETSRKSPFSKVKNRVSFSGYSTGPPAIIGGNNIGQRNRFRKNRNRFFFGNHKGYLQIYNIIPLYRFTFKIKPSPKPTYFLIFPIFFQNFRFFTTFFDNIFGNICGNILSVSI